MKLQVIGFGIVMALAVLGVDLSMQARKTDQSIGQMGFAGYVDTIKGRYGEVLEARALKERQKQLAKVHLPEAPEGWTRREWADGDNSKILPSKHDDLNSDAEMQEALGGQMSLSFNNRAREVWVYESGDEMVSLGVVYSKPKTTGGIQGVALKVIAGNISAMSSTEAFALIQGVAFGSNHLFGVQDEEKPYRVFKAGIGTDIKMIVRANASDESIHMLLNAIDYDALNAMLDHPVETVGTTMPKASAEESLQTAQDILEQKRNAIRDEGQAAENALKDMGRLMGGFAKPDEAADATDASDATRRADAIVTVGATKINVGMAPVAGMPGRKCVRSKGSRLCGGLSD